MKTNLKPSSYPTLAEHYTKKYKGYVQVLENSPLQKARPHGITEYDVVALGRQLDAFKSMCKIAESNGSMAQLDQLPKIGLAVIAAAFGISPVALIAGVQPIPEEIGIVWFEDFIAQNTAGNVNSGNSLMSALSGPGVYPVDYAVDTLRQQSIVTTGVQGNHQTYSSVTIGAGAPIDPQRITIYGSTKFNADADVVTWPTMTPDPTSGQFGGGAKVNGTVYNIYGVVNFTTGVLTELDFSAAPSSGVNIQSDYANLQEAQTDINQALLVMQSKSVKTRFFAMKSSFGLFQQFVAQQRWGMNIQDEMTKKLVTALNNEVMNKVLATVLAAIPANAQRTWVREPGTGIDYLSHKLSLPDAMADTSKLITLNAGRGHASVWIAGLNAASVLEMEPGFTKTFDDSTFGPHVYGTFRGATVIRVPGVAPGTYSGVTYTGTAGGMNPDLLVGLYKGPTPFEAPVAWCPFMPLTVTDVLIQGSNPLQYQKAAAMSGAIETMIPNFLCQLTVDQTNFDYSSF